MKGTAMKEKEIIVTVGSALLIATFVSMLLVSCGSGTGNGGGGGGGGGGGTTNEGYTYCVNKGGTATCGDVCTLFAKCTDPNSSTLSESCRKSLSCSASANVPKAYLACCYNRYGSSCSQFIDCFNGVDW